LLTLAVAQLSATAIAGEDGCRLFLLRDRDRTLSVEPVDLSGSPRTERTFHADTETGIIDVIFPVGPGGSGSMVRLADATALTAVCDAGVLSIESRTADGKGYKRPERGRDDLARYDIRLSVSAGDGRTANFLIDRYDNVRRDEVGPVMDMFAGRIPVKPKEYVLFTETFLHARPERFAGRVPLEIDRWPIATLTLPDGKTGSFIVDIGAGTTVVGRPFLPEGTEIQKSGMVQYSSAGRQILKYAPGGATGQVQNVLGQAVLEGITLGDLRVDEITVDVMSEIPDMFGRPIAGIIGLDLIAQTRVLAFEFPSGATSSAVMSLKRSAMNRDAHTIEVPFTYVNSHLVVTGTINEKPVHFVLDTGAPQSMLDAEAATRVGVWFDESSERAGRGIDGGSAPVYKGGTASLTLGDTTIPDTVFNAGGLPVFQRMTVHQQNAGLLGTAFFARFARMELDFANRVLRLVER